MNLHYRPLALEQPEAPEDASSDDSSGRELSDSELELSGPNRNQFPDVPVCVELSPFSV